MTKKKASVKSGSWWKKNIATLGLALVVAVWIFYVVNDPNIFQASVLTLQDKDILERMERDIGYKVENDTLDIFLTDFDVVKLHLNIQYDDANVRLFTDEIEYQWDLTILAEWDGELQLEITNLKTLDIKQSLVILLYEAEQNNILLSEVQGWDKDGQVYDLAVGRLYDWPEVH